jgi:hypothetical protein
LAKNSRKIDHTLHAKGMKEAAKQRQQKLKIAYICSSNRDPTTKKGVHVTCCR